MVTTIGIDPHKATHTAIAIDGSEMVLGEITIAADRSQTEQLMDWAAGLDGDGRLWAVEAAGGLGYLLSQQLIARGERVVDVPPVLASRVRVLSSGHSEKNDPNDARAVAIAALRQPNWRSCTERITARCYACWPNVTRNSPPSAPKQCVGFMRFWPN